MSSDTFFFFIILLVMVADYILLVVLGQKTYLNSGKILKQKMRWESVANIKLLRGPCLPGCMNAAMFAAGLLSGGCFYVGLEWHG